VTELVSANKLNGRKVITTDAYTLGEVERVNVDIDKWQVTDLLISLTEQATRELAFKKPFLGSVMICLPVIHIQAVGDVITLNKPLQELKDLRECKEEA
jgi:sporulation protein YlmC with PRC-barrel domain